MCLVVRTALCWKQINPLLDILGCFKLLFIHVHVEGTKFKEAELTGC